MNKRHIHITDVQLQRLYDPRDNTPAVRLSIKTYEDVTPACALDALRRAFTRWALTSPAGATEYELSGEDFNVGDFLGLGEFPEDLHACLNEEGIYNVEAKQNEVSVNPGDWHFDTRFMNPELHPLIR